MAKNNVFHKLPAQMLLQDKSVSFSGYLERKVKILSFKPWYKSYCIISNGNLYIYQTSNSLKPSLVCVLSAFDQIRVFKNRSQPPLWVFSLHPIVESIPELKFAAPSEREMQSWICEMRIGIVHSKNIQLKRVEPVPVVKGTSHNNLEGNIYSSASERNEVRSVLMNSKKDNIYEEADEITFQQNSTSPSAPPQQTLYPSLSFDSSYLNEGDNDVNKSVFYGSREDALLQLAKCRFVGSYLVRKDNDRQILTVRCDNNVVKYCLEVNEGTSKVNIVGQQLCFDNVDHLISYYHEHNLPNQNCKLLIPYKLAKSII